MKSTNYTIGEFSRLTGISKRMLRYFEKFNLLKPKRNGKYRIYDQISHCEAASTKMYQNLGLELRQIVKLYDYMNHNLNDKAAHIIKDIIEDNTHTIEKLIKSQHRLKRLHTLLNNNQKPHSFCMLCSQKNENNSTFVAIGVDLICQPCIDKTAGKEITFSSQDNCTVCGTNQQLTVHGTQGSICEDCFSLVNRE